MKRRPARSNLTEAQWHKLVKPRAESGMQFTEIAKLLEAEGIHISRQAIARRVRQDGWLPSKVEDEAKSNVFKDLAPPLDLPLTKETKDVIVKRRCDQGHMWSGPSRIVVRMACPLCSVKTRKR